MRLTDFDYNLPPERIAQTPIEPRDASRLLVLNRTSGAIEHTHFNQIGAYLRPGDLLVINDTKVIPARIYATKPTGGKVELLLLKKLDEHRWEALVGGKNVRQGMVLRISDEILAEVTQTMPGGRREVTFDQPVEPCLRAHGEMPLPPYIHTRLSEPGRYQTIYANTEGSAAAPTAGLHFTQRLIDELKSQEVGFGRVTLNVGLDTFAPVRENDPMDHKIHSEWCELSTGTADLINRSKREGRRVIAVGTTTVRTLESAAVPGPNEVVPFQGPTSLYILPGFHFRIVDGLITNFHLPKSTLLMLVSAYAGRENILNAYNEAIRNEYRFFSFGDAMFIH